MFKGRHFLALGCLVALSGCSTALVKPASTDEDATAKTFQPASGRALLFVYRASRMGGDYVTNVHVNGAPIAKGAYQRYNVLSVAPGHYRLEAKAFLYPDKHPLEVDATDGAIRFFEEAWSPFEGFSLREVQAEQAKASVAPLKLAARVDVPAAQSVAPK